MDDLQDAVTEAGLYFKAVFGPKVIKIKFA